MTLAYYLGFLILSFAAAVGLFFAVKAAKLI